MGNEIWLVMLLIVVTAVCILTPIYLRYLQRIKELETLVKLAEGGHEVRVDMLSLLQPPRAPRNDMRRGLIFLAVGIPLALAFVIDGTYMMAVLLGGIPILAGLGFLVMARLETARAQA